MSMNVTLYDAKGGGRFPELELHQTTTEQTYRIINSPDPLRAYMDCFVELVAGEPGAFSRIEAEALRIRKYRNFFPDAEWKATCPPF